MFSSFDKLRTVQRQPNKFNAYLHHIAKENNGELLCFLTEEQKNEYVEELKVLKETQQYGLRLTQRSRAQDVNHVCKTIEDLLLGLQVRVGVQAFYCVVRSSLEYQLHPRFFFTNRDLDVFLRGSVRRFEPENIGALAEAFSIAGSDYLSFLRSMTEKVTFLRGEVRELLNSGLASPSGDPNATMSYAQYTRDVQLKYKLTLEGWMYSTLCAPSDLPAIIPVLMDIHDHLVRGDCYFHRLDPSEYLALQAEYEQRAESGQVKPRKKRSDAGKPRAKGKQVAGEVGRASTPRGDGIDDNATTTTTMAMARRMARTATMAMMRRMAHGRRGRRGRRFLLWVTYVGSQHVVH
ncbi:hypothetical protein NUW54_g12826 [Trametes sanguinea]|uniref:Uncharacterized protein n=1 Tax=Trametes sanguinea TaxID=158606 RepID=A0ACC1MUJ4_9APHY|nr:hypothetical protein NUW54_g12826 [Trametes sanguinea]